MPSKRGRPPKKIRTKQAAVRFTEEMLARLDRYAERLAARNPGMTITRADALRTLVAEGLARDESDEQR